MAKNKFKVGDIVTCTRNNEYAITDKDVKCKVIRISTNEPDDIVVEIIEDNHAFRGCQYAVQSKNFKKVPSIPFVSKVNGIYCKCIPVEDNEALTKQWAADTLDNLSEYDYQTIIKGKNTIVVASLDGWNTVDVGIARCSKNDDYNVDIGTAIAAAKAMGVEIPSFIYE